MALTYADIKKWGLARLSDVAGGVSGVASFNTRTGAVTAVTADLSDSSAAGRALVTAADAAAQRTALGLGTAATTASSAYATAAQGTTANSALQPGAQLTQSAVTNATAAGVTLLDAANAAAQKTALGITQADVASNAPVALTATTNLTAATHGNRQITFTGASATLTVLNDASGGWAADEEIVVQTLAGSAGVPTISTPDGKNVAGTTSQPVGAKRKGANSWDVYLLPQSAGGSGTTITHLTDYTASSTHTGVTTESAAIKTITLGALTAGQRVRIRGDITGSNSNDTTTLRIKLGGTTVGTLVTGTFSVLDGFRSEIICTGSATQLTLSQKIFSGGTLASTVKTTVNTSSSVDLTFTLQLSATSRTAALEGVDVEVYPA